MEANMERPNVGRDMKIADDMLEQEYRKANEAANLAQSQNIKKEMMAQFDEKLRGMGMLTTRDKEELSGQFASLQEEINKIKDENAKLKTVLFRKYEQGDKPLSKMTNMDAEIDPKLKQKQELEDEFGDLRGYLRR